MSRYVNFDISFGGKVFDGLFVEKHRAAEWEEFSRSYQMKLGMAAYGRATEIERLRVENAVLTAQLETLLAPATPEGWIVTEGPKELLP